MKYRLRVNGSDHEADVAPDTPLLWVLRDALGMTGTKFGCGVAQCGACTLHIGGEPVRACVYPISALGAREVTTIEGVTGREAAAVLEAWDENNVPQCGYCQPGQVMNAAALLRKVPAPTEAEVDAAMTGNVCRCATYPRIRKAIHDAAKKLEV